MEALHEIPTAASIAGILGLALVLAGYWMMRASARFACAVIFAAVGLVFGIQLGEPLLIFGATVGLGILGFFLGDTFYYLYVAANGGLAGYVLAAVVCGLAGWEFSIVHGAIGGIVGGLLNLLFERPLGIFGTSVTGAALTASAAGVIANAQPGSLLFFGVFALLVIGGCVIQSRATRHLPPRNQPDPKKAPARS